MGNVEERLQLCDIFNAQLIEFINQLVVGGWFRSFWCGYLFGCWYHLLGGTTLGWCLFGEKVTCFGMLSLTYLRNIQKEYSRRNMSTKKFGICSRTQERDLGWKHRFRNYYHTGHCSQKLPYIQISKVFVTCGFLGLILRGFGWMGLERGSVINN